MRNKEKGKEEGRDREKGKRMYGEKKVEIGRAKGRARQRGR